MLTEWYPAKEALDEAGTGAQDAMGETFGQLDEMLAGSRVYPARGEPGGLQEDATALT